ncbi:MAG: hypothetical protein DWQ35_21190 [Planctomycetota bacterium]|nr:MAG: hypothetical protein DWQ35_21190 [Planctomycetota bacterium]
MRLSAGDTPIPGYRLDAFLGRGVYGERWKATGPGGSEVALKFIPLSKDQGERQARAVMRLARLHHAHMLPIQGIWRLDADGNVLADLATGSALSQPQVATLVIANTLADGSLADRLEEYLQAGGNGIPARELLQHMEDVARALDNLARMQLDLGGDVDPALPLVHHGGIKPQNILLLSDSAVLADYGLSTALGNRCSSLVASGAVAYQAPECMRGAAAHAASDQYALAVCYTQLRTGRVPLSEESSFDAALQQQQEGRLDLSDLGDAERSVIARATAANPGDRYASCLELVRALQKVVEGGDVISRPVPPVLTVHRSTPLPTSYVPPTPGEPVAVPAGESGVSAAIWAPLFVAACVGFAVYASLQLMSLRKDIQTLDTRTQDPSATASADGAESELAERSAADEDATSGDELSDPAGDALAGDAMDDELTITVPVVKDAADEQAPAIDLADEDATDETDIDEPTTPADDPAAADPSPAVVVANKPEIPDDELDQLDPIVEPADADAATDATDDPPAVKFVDKLDGADAAARLRAADIEPAALELAGGGLAAEAPKQLVAIFGDGEDVDMAQTVSAAQSPDGRLLAMSTKYNQVQVWNIGERALRYELSGHESAVFTMAFSPDGRLLATGGTSDHEVRLWNADDGKHRHTLRGHNGWITAAAFSPDGRLLATGGTDGNVMLWNALTGRLERNIDGPEGRTIHALAFSPQGDKLAVGGIERRIKLYDVNSGDLDRQLRGHENTVRCLAFAGDGGRLASAGEDGTVRIWDLAHGAEPITLDQHTNWVRHLCYAPDGRRLATCGYDGKVHIFEATSGVLAETIEVNPPGNQVLKVMFSPSGRFLTTANGNGTVYILRLDGK